MPFEKFQIHVVALDILLLIIVYVFFSFPKGRVPWGNSRFFFVQFFIPRFREFQIHVLSSYSTYLFLFLGIPKRAGPF